MGSQPSLGQHQRCPPGWCRADVWVFDADAPGAGPGGEPLAINLFADSARGLARSADGSRVYAAAFLSGNRILA
ncbi:MAG: hypothetical protein R6W80_15920 [Haliea sp.]